MQLDDEVDDDAGKFSDGESAYLLLSYMLC